ncbi:MAG: hypothetical protein WA347_09180 [Rhabdochlamydiaceae bacterium]|jgi:hypothetical protein
MNKTFIALLTLSFTFFNAFCFSREYFLEGRASYFYPTEHRFREVYSGGGMYGVEFDMQAWKELFVWVGVDYFHKTGHTHVKCHHAVNGPVQHFKKHGNKTHITLVPCSVGLKYITNTDPVQFYVGAGFLAEYLHTQVNSKYLVRERSRWGYGGAFNTGLLFNIGKSFLIDLFTDYYLVTVHLHRTHKKVYSHHADVSGFSFGGGLGYKF